MNFKDFITENTEFFDSVIADIEVCDRRLILSIFSIYTPLHAKNSCFALPCKRASRETRSRFS